MEDWETVDEFPDYLVSNYGEVYNSKTKQVLTQSKNQQGIANVALLHDRIQYRRSVGLLVAKAFLAPPPREHFNTIINLDGDRFNNHVDNIAWRPRWFAIKYHQQFSIAHKQGFTAPIEIVETGEQFEDSMHAATTYGLLTDNIYDSIMNDRVVFPIGQHFKLVDPMVTDRY